MSKCVSRPVSQVLEVGYCGYTGYTYTYCGYTYYGAWSSKWMPAAPASIIILVSFITAVRPPCPVSPSATIGAW